MCAGTPTALCMYRWRISRRTPCITRRLTNDSANSRSDAVEAQNTRLFSVKWFKRKVNWCAPERFKLQPHWFIASEAEQRWRYLDWGTARCGATGSVGSGTAALADSVRRYGDREPQAAPDRNPPGSVQYRPTIVRAQIETPLPSMARTKSTGPWSTTPHRT